jgi:DNA-binding IclR family transcriptional regulator
MVSTNATKKSPEVSSLARAMAILRIVAEAGDNGVRLADIAKHSELQGPTVHRICRGLLSEGMICQPSGQKRYFLGSALSVMTSLPHSRTKLADAGSDALDRLATETGDTVFLFLRDGIDALCVARAEGSYPVRPLVVSVGDRRPLGMGAGGVAILAALPDDDVLETIRLLLKHRPECAERGKVWFENAVANTRRHGFVRQSEGLISGVSGISVAISGATGSPFGALSVAGIESRWPDHRREAMADTMHKEAHEIRQALFLVGNS